MRSEQVAHVLPRSREVPGLGWGKAAVHEATEAHHIGLVEGHPELALAAELSAGDTLDVYHVGQLDLEAHQSAEQPTAAGAQQLGRLTAGLALLLLNPLQHVEGRV